VGMTTRVGVPPWNLSEPVRAKPAPAASRELYEYRVAVELRCVRPGWFLAEEARACLEVELPQVVDATERSSAEVSVDQWVAFVRAGVLECMHAVACPEERDLATFDRDECAVGRSEDLQRDTVAQAA